MPKFTDAQGRVWNPRITLRVISAFEEQTGKSLFDETTMASIMEMRSMLLASRLAFIAVADQARKLKVSFDEFGEAFETTGQMQGMFAAVGEALELFTQSQQSGTKGAK